MRENGGPPDDIEPSEFTSSQRRRTSIALALADPQSRTDGLSWPVAGTLPRLESTSEEAEARLEKLSGAYVLSSAPHSRC